MSVTLSGEAVTTRRAHALDSGQSVCVTEDEVAPDDRELVRLQRQLDEARRQAAQAQRDVEASARFLEESYKGEALFAATILQSAAVVFGLTIGFVTPNLHHLGGVRVWELCTALAVLPLAMLFSMVAMMSYRLGWNRVAANRAGTLVAHPVPSRTPLLISMVLFVAGVSLLGVFSVQEVVR